MTGVTQHTWLWRLLLKLLWGEGTLTFLFGFSQLAAAAFNVVYVNEDGTLRHRPWGFQCFILFGTVLRTIPGPGSC